MLLIIIIKYFFFFIVTGMHRPRGGFEPYGARLVQYKTRDSVHSHRSLLVHGARTRNYGQYTSRQYCRLVERLTLPAGNIVG